MTAPTRGIRNNNPANLRRTGDRWLGMRQQQTDGAFVQFDTMAYGLRALIVVLRNYYTLHGLRTVRRIIARFAPEGENDTAAYVEYVARIVGRGADEEIACIDFRDAARFHNLTMLRLCYAICRMESRYSMTVEEFERALEMALGEGLQ